MMTAAMPTEPDQHEQPPSTTNPSGVVDIEAALAELKTLGNRLRMHGRFILSCAAYTLIAVMVGITFLGAWSNKYLGQAVLFCTLLLAAAGIVFLFFWEQFKRHGERCYVAISDALEWRHKINPSSLLMRPDSAVHAQLREFLDATALPFTNANLSGTVYLVFFLFCIFTALFGIMFTGDIIRTY